MTLTDDNFYLGPTRVYSARQVEMWLESCQPLVAPPCTSPPRMSDEIPRLLSVPKRSNAVRCRRTMRGTSRHRRCWCDALGSNVCDATAAAPTCSPLLFHSPTDRSRRLRSLAECRSQSETSKSSKARVCRV